MKAAVLIANGRFEIQERPTPTITDDEYLVKVDSAGICNSDIQRAFAGGAYHYPLVMGHEIAHAVANHGGERMSQGIIAQMGGIALAVAIKQKPRQTQQLWMMAFGLGAQIGVMLPYSRLHESEADRLGLIFMAMAGYDPHKAVGFWKRMSQNKKGKAPPEFLSTHPASQTRINNIKASIPEAMDYFKKH